MTRARVLVRPYRLRATRVIVTSTTRLTHRTGWLVGLVDADGHTGWGDAAGWPGFSVDLAALEPALRALEVAGEVTLDALPLDGLPLEVAHALDAAALDLAGQHAGRNIAALLAGDSAAPVDAVPVHALVNTAVDALEAVRRGHRAVKVKLGASAIWQDDLTRAGAIRAAIGPDIGLRVDVNGAWRGDQALRACEWLRPLAPEFVEQPSLSIEDCARVRHELGLPVALDEGVTTLASLEHALALDALDVAVIKPMFAGGLRPAWHMAARALTAGKRVVVTCALESAIGRAGALHLAAALGGGVSGLEAPLAEDVAPWPASVNGLCAVPRGPGLGISPG